MDFTKLTEADIESAKVYMPLRDKMAFVDKAAKHCYAAIEVRTDIGGTVVRSYRDATDKKSLWMMTALWRYYLGCGDIKADDCISVEDYDKLAGVHIFNQLERFKSDAKLRNKIFDMLADYRDLEKRLSTEIYHELKALNATTVQLLDQLEATMTPDRVQQLGEQMNEIQGKLQEFQQSRKVAGGDTDG